LAVGILPINFCHIYLPYFNQNFSMHFYLFFNFYHFSPRPNSAAEFGKFVRKPSGKFQNEKLFLKFTQKPQFVHNSRVFVPAAFAAPNSAERCAKVPVGPSTAIVPTMPSAFGPRICPRTAANGPQRHGAR
jgi:hypothetical protein